MIEFRWKTLRIAVHFSFFAVLLLMLELIKSDWGLWCAGAALFHETGHLLAYTAVGTLPREIHLECGGIRIVPPAVRFPPKTEAAILFAGSGANFLACGILCLFRCRTAAGFHLLLGIFNLLPLPSLDGGQLLSLLADQLFSPRRGELFCRTAAILTILPLLWEGWQIFQENGNFTLLLSLFCLIISAFPLKRN